MELNCIILIELVRFRRNLLDKRRKAKPGKVRYRHW